MSDEEAQPKRRGRVSKKRHDPDEAPVDGNPGCDRVFNKEAGFTYVLASDEDIPTILYRGGEVCTRDREQAKPFFDFRKDAGEAEIKVKNLTLMKISDELYEKHQGFGLAEAKRRMAALRRSATQQIGGGQFARIHNDEGGFSRQVI